MNLRVPGLQKAVGVRLPDPVGSNYMLEHWLAAYAVLYLGESSG
jgi:hypothetical protein